MCIFQELDVGFWKESFNRDIIEMVGIKDCVPLGFMFEFLAS